jgi:dienelactone hydrolase
MTIKSAAIAVFLLSALSAFGATAPPFRPEHEVTAQQLVYQVPGMEKVLVLKNVAYKKTDSGELKLDLYYPPDFRKGSELPTVVFINGVGDQAGSKLKEWGPYRSWGALVAASGWVGVTFEARGPYNQSRPDIADLFRFLHSDGARLGVDVNRIAAWVCSGNVFSGLPVLMEEKIPGLVCAVVYYGSAPLTRIRGDLPVLIVRAGRDNRELNQSIDRLVGMAVASGAPWTLVNAPGSHHAFDVLDETEESRRIVRQTIEFFRNFLAPAAAPTAPASLARKALGHWFAHEYAEAAAAYGEYVKTHPEDEVAHLRLGLSQAHAQKFDEAEANLKKAVSLGANRPGDLYNVGVGYALMGKGEKALDFLERAVSEGFKDKTALATDEDLAGIRGTERFQKLLKRIS